MVTTSTETHSETSGWEEQGRFEQAVISLEIVLKKSHKIRNAKLEH